VGLSPEATAAFVLVKRAKELVWIAAGYALLALVRQPQTGALLRPSRALALARLRWLPRSA
jgi:hypothetical protein